jgi:hypothetical protein
MDPQQLSLHSWLAALGCAQYEGALRREGCESVHDLTLLEGEHDLSDLGVKPLFHRRKIWQAVESLKARGKGWRGGRYPAPQEETGKHVAAVIDVAVGREVPSQPQRKRQRSSTIDGGGGGVDAATVGTASAASDETPAGVSTAAIHGGGGGGGAAGGTGPHPCWIEISSVLEHSVTSAWAPEECAAATAVCAWLCRIYARRAAFRRPMYNCKQDNAVRAPRLRVVVCYRVAIALAHRCEGAR